MAWEMGFDCSTCVASASACSSGYNQFLFMEGLERELCLSLLEDSSEPMLWHAAVCVISILCLMADCISFWVGTNP